MHKSKYRQRMLTNQALLLCFCLLSVGCSKPGTTTPDAEWLTVKEAENAARRSSGPVYSQIKGQLERVETGGHMLLHLDASQDVVDPSIELPVRFANSASAALCEGDLVLVTGWLVLEDGKPLVNVEDIDELADIRRHVYGTCE